MCMRNVSGAADDCSAHIRVVTNVVKKIVSRASQEGHTARQVARAKSYKSVEQLLPKDPNQRGCILL